MNLTRLVEADIICLLKLGLELQDIIILESFRKINK